MATVLSAPPASRPAAEPSAASPSSNGEPTEVPVVLDPTEVDEWLESVDDILHRHGPEALSHLLTRLYSRAQAQGVPIVPSVTTPYVNTIPVEAQAQFPGDLELERKLRSVIRWNAMAMVLRAFRSSNVGGHIATYASCANLVETGFNHFFHARTADHTGDMVYFQGHSSPGMYSRAFVEGRLTEANLNNFRRELPRGQGLSSYPHPWLMPHFWQFPTVSMGLGPICSIYNARFMRYLQHRGLLDTSKSRLWAFLGDGEVDEPESLGAISMAARERLDNLTWVINCNLQRLDGPVRGNGKIIQELEGIFRGAGWNVIKVVWGSGWDGLFEADETGILVKTLGEVVDGQFQKYSVETGDFIRKDFFGRHPDLLKLIEHMSDEQIKELRRGGHDTLKVYAGFKAATEHKGAPTVVLAHTVKGFGLTPAHGKNTAHQEKGKGFDDETLLKIRDRAGLPLTDEQTKAAAFYRPPADSPEMQYLLAQRQKLGGFLPARNPTTEKLAIPSAEHLIESAAYSSRPRSTTMVLSETIKALIKEKDLGKRIVPIIPDEAQTFGMEALFSLFGIYSSKGQLYTPVDAGTPRAYKESINGQILMEGIDEAGAMSSFVAAGTAYANVGLSMIPFYIYYSMFGFQRVGDLIWLAADSRCKGFLCGGTSGRTTLNGEGLQHEDGHSQLMAGTVPNLLAYDPAYGYELCVIIQDGLRRMYVEGEDIFYYLSVYNEDYVMPTIPAGVEQGIIKGLYPLDPAIPAKKRAARPQLFGSGPILNEVIRAQKILAEKYGVEADVWSVTSYNELKREAQSVARWNRLHPDQKPRTSHIEQSLSGLKGPFISSSDNVQLVAEQIRPYVPGQYVVCGTDGFGRSETREVLRRHFEIDAESVAYTTLVALSKEGRFDVKKLPSALKELGIDSEKIDPATA